ncbi:MAG TPA: DUF3108 domain-containing protein [Woeseiaceae bacterium]|jgi:hypothetical protein|nr:DUF3108 domain-containing protein [Woeseiaceae bacterium]
MRPALRLLPLLLLVLLNPARSATLTPHRVEYAVGISILHGRLTTVVTKVDSGFMASSVIEPVGLSKLLAHGSIQESSYFVVDGRDVRPEQYRSIDTLSRENQHVTFDFNWYEETVKGTVNEQPIRFTLNGRVHDRVSIQYQLMLDLLNGGASERYFMLDGDEMKQLEVKSIGSRHVSVPYGEFEAIGIQHRKKDSSRITTLWCVEELGFLPVIIEQHHHGKLRVRARLTEYQPMTPSGAKAADPVSD